MLVAVALGIVSPEWGKAMRPLGDTFVNLVKMVIAPIIFLTIVSGIATIGDIKNVGRSPRVRFFRSSSSPCSSAWRSPCRGSSGATSPTDAIAWQGLAPVPVPSSVPSPVAVG